MDTRSDHGNEADEIALCPLGELTSLEKFLLELGLSKSKIKKYLPRKALDKLMKNEMKLPSELLNNDSINPYYLGPPCDILFEDKRFVVLNKPSNVHGHPLNYSDRQNLLSFLRSQDKGKYLQVNPDKQERGLLYRLDYETSGVLVYVKEQSLYDELFNNRETRIVEKAYLALVHGKTEKEKSLVNHLKGSEKKGSKVIEDPSGQLAELSYKTLNYDQEKDLSLVKVFLKTGLRHQIRVQMSEHGHPLLGDVKYGGKEADRLYLHAYEYTVDLNDEKGVGGQLKFQAPCDFTF